MDTQLDIFERSLEAATALDQRITDVIGTEPLATPESLLSPESYRSFVPPEGSAEPYALHPEYYTELKVDAAAIMALGVRTGQIITLRRRLASVPGTVINPAIVRGIAPGSNAQLPGLVVTYLLDQLPAGNPAVGELQDLLLRDYAGLSEGGVGTHAAEKKLAELGASGAAEPGLGAMALRSLTDNNTLQQVRQGIHVAHEWTGRGRRGIVQAITQRDSTKPGVHDIALPGEKPYQPIAKTVVLRPGSTTTILYSPDYKAEPVYVLQAGVSVRRLLTAVGIQAAKSTLGQSAEALASTLLHSFEGVAEGVGHA